jgi:RNase P protein component
MLPKEKRINKQLFEKIIKSPNVLYNSLFSFRFIKSEKPHYSFVTPKSLFKTAVSRNKYKRIGFNYLKNINLKNYSGLFFYKKEVFTMKKEEIREKIEEIIEKLK